MMQGCLRFIVLDFGFCSFFSTYIVAHGLPSFRALPDPR